jgi:very-short-patch-repair endonuclease
MHLGAKASTFRNAFHLRNRETEAEKILWEHLKDRQMEGVRFRRQHPTKRYVLDFYAHELKLVIEIDEKYHSEKGQIFSDNDRDQNLGRNKRVTIRFKESEVLYTLEKVLDEIRKKIISLKAFYTLQAPVKLPKK